MSPSGSVGPPMMCDVCGVRLNTYEQWTGDKLERITWEHTGLFPEGTEPHDPVPVLLESNALPRAGFCDFCNSSDPIWCFPAGPFQLDVAIKPGTGETLGWGSEDNWAACQECKDDIEARKWESVEKRYFSHKDVPRQFRTALLKEVRGLHRMFRLHRLGPPFLYTRADVDKGK